MRCFLFCYRVLLLAILLQGTFQSQSNSAIAQSALAKPSLKIAPPVLTAAQLQIVRSMTAAQIAAYQNQNPAHTSESEKSDHLSPDNYDVLKLAKLD